MVRLRVWPSLLACLFACGASPFHAQTPAPAPTPAPAAYPAQTALGARIQALLATGPASQAHWGIAVTAEDGTPVYGLDEAKLFRPASTAKLFTTAAAMAVLGPDATVQTTVYFPTPDASGTVTGDITLVGANDANLGTQDVPWSRSGSESQDVDTLGPLQDFATEVAARGVRRISGKVIASSYPWNPYPQGWEIEDQLPAFGAPVTSLSLADNTLRLTVKAGAIDAAPALVSLRPAPDVYRVVSTVRTTNDGSQTAHVSVHHVPGDSTLHIDGLLAVGKTYTAEVAVDDPPALAATIFRQLLLAKGILIDGVADAPREYLEDPNFLAESRLPLSHGLGRSEPMGSFIGSPPVFLRHESPSLQQDITATLKESLNLHAELMLRRLGHAPSMPIDLNRSDAVEGARVIHQWLIDQGISDHDFVFYDGSGLSTKDLVTPRAEATLLAYAIHQPWFAQWKAALPVGGIDGTLASRFTGPLKGKVFAKTGTLGETRALAGYVQCASGRELIFSILEDGHMPSDGDTGTLDRIVAAIAELN